ncbi:hypothetical protein ANAPH2_01028 [Anaplasma phagocytophilum]|nr:hypothetical protein ANAPH2_01028 [Anaplasma phagocytophilum]
MVIVLILKDLYTYNLQVCCQVLGVLREYGRYKSFLNYSHESSYKATSAISHQPSAISHQPSAISHQPSAISHQPSAISHQPSAISHQLSMCSSISICKTYKNIQICYKVLICCLLFRCFTYNKTFPAI